MITMVTGAAAIRWLAPYVVAMLTAALLAAGLATVAWGRRREGPVALPLAVLMAAVAVWALAEGASVVTDGEAAKTLWFRVRFLGSAVVPTAWLVLCLRYAGWEVLVSRRVLAGLAVEPAITVALVWTPGASDLVWTGTALVAGGRVLDVTFGPWFWANLGYSYLLVTTGLLLLASVALGSESLYRRQAFALLGGALIPLAANAVYVLGLSPVMGLDLTPVGFVVTGLTFALALFYLDLLDVAPLARRELLSELVDGVLVLDTDGRVVESNQAAARALGTDLAPGERPGIPAPIADLDGHIHRTETEGRPRTYRVRSRTLTDHRGDGVGDLVLFSDVTDLAEREQRLSVLNRVFRHNIRNEMTVVRGNVERVADRPALDEADRRALESARAATERVIALGEKATTFEHIPGGDADPRPVEVDSVLATICEAARERFPEAVVSLERSGGPHHALALDERSLATALEYLIETRSNTTTRAPPASRSPSVALRRRARAPSGSASRTTVPGSPRRSGRSSPRGGRRRSATGADWGSGSSTGRSRPRAGGWTSTPTTPGGVW
jgi:PAS domain-containing protein